MSAFEIFSRNGNSWLLAAAEPASEFAAEGWLLRQFFFLFFSVGPVDCSYLFFVFRASRNSVLP
jgi:hypothetical protein